MRGRVVSAFLIAVAALFGAAVSTAGDIPGFQARRLETPADDFPGPQTRGPHGEIWFSDFTGGIGRIGADGRIEEWPIPSSGGAWSPSALAFGPDGAIWFLATRIAVDVPETRMLRWRPPAGDFAELPIPTPTGGGGPVAVGPDGRIWYAQAMAGKIGRVGLSGSVEEIALDADAFPNDLAAGSDGNVWVVLEQSASVARITPAGEVTAFPIPPAGGTASQPARIVPGPGGNLYFSDPGTNSIGMLTVDGGFSRFPIPTGDSEPYGLAASPGGRFVYFAERTPDAIGRLDPSTGTIDESSMPPAASRQFPHEITAAFPRSGAAGVETYVVNSPDLYVVNVPADVPRGPSLRLSIAKTPSDGDSFAVVATISNAGDADTAAGILVSMTATDGIDVVAAPGCTTPVAGTLVCPLAGTIPAGGSRTVDVTAAFADPDRRSGGIRAWVFGGGDGSGPIGASVTLGRSVAPPPVPPEPAVIERRGQSATAS